MQNPRGTGQREKCDPERGLDIVDDDRIQESHLSPPPVERIEVVRKEAGRWKVVACPRMWANDARATDAGVLNASDSRERCKPHRPADDRIAESVARGMRSRTHERGGARVFCARQVSAWVCKSARSCPRNQHKKGKVDGAQDVWDTNGEEGGGGRERTSAQEGERRSV
ncbi:hypothetical protein C8F04DRAFT_1186089 [Mycena alexandri]|uniref:Uncharacterized protein n=1 Tax=Mycena alexandri TaxID=1745969 RepID=A0AAD6SP09_9AGAR|nr:hypothetical protein C8F04DRAFT_1186089 [Mycena alexandri]